MGHPAFELFQICTSHIIGSVPSPWAWLFEGRMAGWSVGLSQFPKIAAILISVFFYCYQAGERGDLHAAAPCPANRARPSTCHWDKVQCFSHRHQVTQNKSQAWISCCSSPATKSPFCRAPKFQECHENEQFSKTFFQIKAISKKWCDAIKIWSQTSILLMKRLWNKSLVIIHFFLFFCQNLANWPLWCHEYMTVISP